MDKYFIYSKSDCPYCQATEELMADLKSQGKVDYVIEKIENRADREKIYDELGLKGNARTMPQIFFDFPDGNRMRIGGHTDSADKIKALYA